MAKAPITRERIDELLRFLPALGTPGPGTEPKWHGLDQEPKDGVFIMPYPTYPAAVNEFFQLARQDCWCDFGYVPEQAGEMVRDDAAIASASLTQIKTMLTFCVRGERFCDGHWGAMVREGRIGAILRRLSQLRGEAPDAEPGAAADGGGIRDFRPIAQRAPAAAELGRSAAEALMGKAEVPHRLYWNKQLVGVITEATFSDFPWVIGRFEARRVGKRLREVLDWFVAQSEEDQSQDPPFEAEFLEGWVIVKPDGERHELFLPPLIDFDKGFAEWR